ncbi:MAG TPA: hypothetical protein DCF63_05840 [Planctomycetaceae bacterium]|nr:hypothetical protein [Planctomycetaceae bacterium]
MLQVVWLQPRCVAILYSDFYHLLGLMIQTKTSKPTRSSKVLLLHTRTATKNRTAAQNRLPV